MRRLRVFVRRVAGLFGKANRDCDLADEIESNLQFHIDDNLRAGLTPQQARRKAIMELGGIEQTKEVCRDQRGLPMLETALQDLRYGARMLRKNPGFTVVAVLTLALGIGANTAIFTLIDAILLQNLTVRDPGKLVLFYRGIDAGIYTGNSFPGNIFSYQSWQYLREHNESFEGLCAFQQGSDRLTLHVEDSQDGGPREDARGHLVSGNYFEVLGVHAAVGRTLTPEDDTITAPPVTVISYSFWQQRFLGKPSVLGTVADLNGTAFTIIGVAPREFFGERVQAPPDFWVPLAKQPQVMQRESLLTRQDAYWLNLIGRLKPGVTIAGAEAALNTQLHQFYKAQAGSQLSPERERKIQQAHIALSPGGRGVSWMRTLYSEPLRVLMGVVALVLLIACANVAALLLARASGRSQEWFMRLALGANRGRLVRQLLTESTLLALLGGAAGIVLAWWGVRVLIVMVGVPSVIRVAPDLLILGFTVAVSLLTGVLFGVVPALRVSRVAMLASGYTRSRGGSLRLGPAKAFVVLQVALSLILLVVAALLTHSFVGLERQDLGFKAEHVLVVSTDPRLADYQPAQLYPLYRLIEERLNALPGVLSASIARYTPISGSTSSTGLSIEGYSPVVGKEMRLYGVEVGPRFFETLGIPLLRGRTIGPQDTPTSPRVAVVNETFVRSYLPNENPIGRHFSTGAPFKGPGIEIIGVVADARYYDAREKPKPMAFFGAWQGEVYAGDLVVRTSTDPLNVADEVRRTVKEIDTKLPILSVGTMHDQIYKSLDQERMIARLCGFFGVLGLLLACIGLYGTVSYSVGRRTQEIGIRIALGASRANVLWMILRESIMLISLGLAFGLPLAITAARSIQSFLFGLPSVDVVGIGAAMVAMTFIAAVAGYLPAGRAAKVDPMVALRNE